MRRPSRAEFALLALGPGAAIPTGGVSVSARIRTGRGEGEAWSTALGEYFRQLAHVELSEGTCNLWVDDPLAWPDPARARVTGISWELCPVILDERAIGVAVRQNTDAPTFLEIVSPVRLRSALGNPPDETIVGARLLPGAVLQASDRR